MKQLNASTIVIAGLGLMGGSMAMALRRAGCPAVLGIDRDPDTLAAALRTGAVDRAGDPELLQGADILILALSPEAAVSFLQEHVSLLPAGALVTDVCGVKRAVVEALAPICREHGLLFIGGHPMAGKEKSGFAAADPCLFKGASYILTPGPDTPDEAVEVMRTLALALGCTRLTVTSPSRHDRMIAFTSQLPHVLAGAYVKSPCCPFHKGFSAGSYRDVSRVAAVDETLWSQLFLLNADDLCAEIDTLIANLTLCRDAVASGDKARLEEVLREGRQIKENEGRFEAGG